MKIQAFGIKVGAYQTPLLNQGTTENKVSSSQAIVNC
jgi:hypothetical protein